MVGKSGEVAEGGEGTSEVVDGGSVMVDGTPGNGDRVLSIEKITVSVADQQRRAVLVQVDGVEREGLATLAETIIPLVRERVQGAFGIQFVEKSGGKDGGDIPVGPIYAFGTKWPKNNNN